MHLNHHQRFGLIALVMALALVAFTWPSGRLAPRDVPVGVVGPTPTSIAADHGYEIHPFASPADARTAIRDRHVYGAIVGRQTYIATAASPAVAQRLRQILPGNRVTDLAPGTRHDPQAATVTSMTLPISVLGIFLGVLAALTTRGKREQLVTLIGGGVIAGLLASLVTKTWLNAIPGPWLLLAGSVALAVIAVGTLVIGLVARLGPPGIGVAAVLTMLVGNAWSAASTAPELLPEPVSFIGRLLPPGAFGQLARSVGWFDGAGAAGPVIVLSGWVAVGLALLLLPASRAVASRVPEAQPRIARARSASASGGHRLVAPSQGARGRELPALRRPLRKRPAARNPQP